MNFKTFKIVVVLVGLFFISTFVSCSKNDEEVTELDPQNVESEEIEEENITESDDDLLNVDYKEFYDVLAPHGEWIEITEEDIGVDFQKETASGNRPHRKMSFSDLFGVNSAYADDASFGAFFVWKPAPELAVGISTGNTQPTTPAVSYVPYTNGQWTYTDAGWYFQAPTPHEEVVHHYGRWAYSPSVGWVWVPGRVWSPAWVDWRTDDDYVAWTPVPPGIYIADDRVMHPYTYEDRYVVVEKRYFMHPHIYKHKHKKSKILVTQLTPVPGITVINNTIFNQGPQLHVIQTYYPQPIETVKIKKVKHYQKIGYYDHVIHTYSPKFKKFKHKKNIFKPVRKPESYSSIENWTAGNNNKDVKKIGGDPWKIDNNSKENVIYKDNNSGRNDKVKINKKNNDTWNGKGNDNNRSDKKIKNNNDRGKKNDNKFDKPKNNKEKKINSRGKDQKRNDPKLKQDRKKSGNNKVMGDRERKNGPGKNKNSDNNSKRIDNKSKGKR